MNPSRRKTVQLYPIFYLLLTSLLVACNASSATKTTSISQEIDQGIVSNATATPKINATSTESIATLTPPTLPTLTQLTLTPSPSVTSSPGLVSTPTSLGGWLVFESASEDTNGDGSINRSDNTHIFSLNLNTNELTQLTYGGHRDLQPAWSPNRSNIVFSSNRNGNFDLYIMKADGSEIQQLIDTSVDEVSPIWSADGQQIIYVSVETFENGLQERELYIVSANGENNRQLIDVSGNSFDPDLSPDGRFLTYTQVEPFTVEGEIRTGTVVYLYDLQSGQNIRITSHAFELDKGQFQRPKWLPREGWYLSMVQTPGDLNPSGMKIFEITWDQDTPLLTQVLEFDEGPGNYTWGPNGEWLISANNHTIFANGGEGIMTTDISFTQKTIPLPQGQQPADPALQHSEHVLSEEGIWLTDNIFYEGHLDWAP